MLPQSKSRPRPPPRPVHPSHVVANRELAVLHGLHHHHLLHAPFLARFSNPEKLLHTSSFCWISSSMSFWFALNHFWSPILTLYQTARAPRSPKQIPPQEYPLASEHALSPTRSRHAKPPSRSQRTPLLPNPSHHPAASQQSVHLHAPVLLRTTT
jgi:hypothetical protein